MNLWQSNISKLKNYTESDFGYFVFELERPNYYLNNHIYINKVTDYAIEILKTFSFKYVLLTKEIADKYNIEVEHETLNILKHTKKLPATSNYKDTQIQLATLNDIDEIKIFEHNSQIAQYDIIFNEVDENYFVNQNFYIIKHKNKIISTFREYDNNTFEDIFILEEYRKQGITRNYLNLLSNKTHRLVCYTEVLDFYFKCGFTLESTIDEYSTANIQEVINKLSQKKEN